MSLQSPNNQEVLMSLWTDGQEFFAYPLDNTALPTPSTAGLTAGESVWNHHDGPASDHGDESSQSPDSDFARPVTAITAYVQWGPQYNFSTYQTQPLGTGEHHTTEDPRGHGNRRSVCPKVKPRHTCATCKKGFKRKQELNRHRRDTHEPRRQCPFCALLWTRPSIIKSHIEYCHYDQFTAELLGEFSTLRGKKIIEFLDTGYYDYVFDVGAMTNIASLDFPGFPYLL